MQSSLSIILRDESFPRTQATEALFRLNKTKLSARLLIAERVRAEHDQRLVAVDGAPFMPLVERTTREAVLNGPPKTADPERQIEKALSAFLNNAFVLLVDDQQITDLDQEITLQDHTTVSFLRLTPLQGG